MNLTSITHLLQVKHFKRPAKVASLFHSQLPFAQFPAHYGNLSLCKSNAWKLNLIPHTFPAQTLKMYYYWQISYRVFDLTNLLKTAFIPSKDNKRLFHNFISGATICVALYCISWIILHIPGVSIWHVMFSLKILTTCIELLDVDHQTKPLQQGRTIFNQWSWKWGFFFSFFFFVCAILRNDGSQTFCYLHPWIGLNNCSWFSCWKKKNNRRKF